MQVMGIDFQVQTSFFVVRPPEVKTVRFPYELIERGR